MKGRKMGSGGMGPSNGDKDWKHEAKPVARNSAPKIMGPARAKRKSGGKVDGDAAPKNAGRAPRKSGGRVGSNANPFSSARSGTTPPGRTTNASSQ